MYAFYSHLLSEYAQLSISFPGRVLLLNPIYIETFKEKLSHRRKAA